MHEMLNEFESSQASDARLFGRIGTMSPSVSLRSPPRVLHFRTRDRQPRRPLCCDSGPRSGSLYQERWKPCLQGLNFRRKCTTPVTF